MGDDVERIRKNPCKHGLGTFATRVDIIEKLVKDGYVKRKKAAKRTAASSLNLFWSSQRRNLPAGKRNK